jgi:NADH-quinone oxidoreductase subunit C
MTRAFSGDEVAEAIERAVPGSVVERQPSAVVVSSQHLEAVCTHLRNDPTLAFDFLSSLTAVDYLDYFEVVYHLNSLGHNTGAVLKVRTEGRSDPAVPTVSGVWRGALLQEREAWDLMGIRFAGHPDLRRVLLWEGFPGHPLRKDFLDFDHRTIAMSATQAAAEDR